MDMNMGNMGNMGWMMGGMWIIGILLVVLFALSIGALAKYLFFSSSRNPKL
jgi:hypothetical protein